MPGLFAKPSNLSPITNTIFSPSAGSNMLYTFCSLICRIPFVIYFSGLFVRSSSELPL